MKKPTPLINFLEKLEARKVSVVGLHFDSNILLIVETLRGVWFHFDETETPFCRGVPMTPRNDPGG